MEQEIKEESESQDSGSTEYLANAEVDKVLKKVKDDIKHYMAVQGQREYKYKAQRVVAAAKELDTLDYPKSEICDRLTKTLKGLVSERHVREALDPFPEYKNPVQKQIAQSGGDIAANTKLAEDILKKAKQRITSDEVKHLNLPKAKEVLKYQMAQAEWWKQQLRQSVNEIVELGKNTKYSDAEFREAFTELAKKLEDQVKAYADIETDEQESPKPARKSNKRGRPKKMGKAKEKMDLLNDMMAARAEGRIIG